MIAAILFNQVIGGLTPVIVLGSLGAYFVLRWERVAGLFMDCWPILLLPLFAMFSAFWSPVPGTTLRYGTLYFLTVLTAVVIGAGTRREAYLFGYFIAFTAYNAVSLMTFRFVRWGLGGTTAFVGLGGSKNTAGEMAAVGLIASLALACWALNRRKVVIATISVSAVPVMMAILWFSRATGARIAGAMGCICLLLWFFSRKLPTNARMGIFVAVILVVGLLMSTYNIWMPPLYEAVLASSGKDEGLSGRGDLWAFADNKLIATRPWLGLGYNAFWLHGNLDAEGIWQAMDIQSRMGFNFHNTFREILVHMGYVGLALYGVVAIVATLRLFSSALVQPRMSSIFACSLAIYFAMQLPVEVMGVTTMHFGTISLMAVLAMGLRRDRALP